MKKIFHKVANLIYKFFEVNSKDVHMKKTEFWRWEGRGHDQHQKGNRNKYISALRREDASKNVREWFEGDLRWIHVIFEKG